MRKLLKRKIKHCKRVRKIFPESRLYLIGDNGQADIDLGKALLEDCVVDTVFIHNIYPLLLSQDQDSDDEILLLREKKNSRYRDIECQEVGIVLYETYVGAALEAYRRNLFSSFSLLSVVQACVSEHASIRYSSSMARDSRMDALKHDMINVKLELEKTQDNHLIQLFDLSMNEFIN